MNIPIGVVHFQLNHIFSIIAGAWVLYLFWRNVKEKQLSNMVMLWEKLHNKEALNVFYKIEYEEQWYNGDFHGSEIESSFDQYFATISLICFLNRQGALRGKYMKAFEYDISRILQNQQVIDYLYNVHHYALANKRESLFAEIEKYAEEHGYIEASRFNDPKAHSNNSILHKYLEW